MTDAPPAHILVVDDEPALRKLMKMFLERLGYSVDTLADAASALECFRADPAKYKLIVADLNLPDMQGDAMGLLMLDINPDVRILLCSGYPCEVESLPAARRHRFASLQKPFVPSMLVSAVSDLIER